MFIIRNKETKLFPTEYCGEKIFPLTSGHYLADSLAGYYYGPVEEDIQNLLNTKFNNDNKYEVVKFKWCKSFKISQLVNNRNIDINGFGELSFYSNEGTEYVYDEEGNYVYGRDEVAIEIPSYQKHFQLILYNGNAEVSYWARTDEGSEYESFIIELVCDEDGFPYWEINSDCGGTDCDGPIEHHRFYISYGGGEGENSPLQDNPNRKGYNRDHYAEAMGY